MNTETVKIEVPFGALDSVVVTLLKEDIKDLKFTVKHSSIDADVEDAKDTIKAMKRVLKYYGAT